MYMYIALAKEQRQPIALILGKVVSHREDPPIGYPIKSEE